jgi:hypothetical protein
MCKCTAGLIIPGSGWKIRSPLSFESSLLDLWQSNPFICGADKTITHIQRSQ